MIRWLAVGLILLAPLPVWAQVALNVDQTHTLNWNWQSDGSAVRSFVFRCGQYRKDILDADARSLRFGSLVDSPGRYTGCTIAAQNEAGLSAPAIVPDFEYTYSYGALLRFLLECAATLGALAGIVRVYGRQILIATMTRLSPLHPIPTAPLTLEAPLLVLEKETQYVHHDS